MKLLRCVLLLQFTTGLALSQPAQQSQPASVPRQPEALVRSLYQKVVARQTVGIPYSADMKIFAPYLSKTLRHRIQLARACGNDWFRQQDDQQQGESAGRRKIQRTVDGYSRSVSESGSPQLAGHERRRRQDALVGPI